VLLRRPVFDRTAIAGRYGLDVAFVSDEDEGQPSSESGPRIYGAIEKELG
jgi:uncharacterized protein (TIGR03435 family)